MGKRNLVKEELIELSKAGDMKAFGELVSQNQGWLRGWLRGQLRDWTAADDLAQDAFVTAFRKINEFRGDGSFEAWLRSIAHNHFRNYIRKRREEYIGGSEELQALLANREIQSFQGADHYIEVLKDCLNEVSPAEKSLLDERYTVGRSVQDIAKRNAIGYSAMTMKLHRLRKLLANCVEAKTNLNSHE